VPADTATGGAILSRLESIGSLAAETNGELFNDAGQQADRVLERISEASQDYYLVDSSRARMPLPTAASTAGSGWW